MEQQHIKVRLFHSTIGTPPDQRATVVGLGLRRLYQERLLQDTPAIRGMIRKVAHLVSFETFAGPATRLPPSSQNDSLGGPPTGVTHKGPRKTTSVSKSRVVRKKSAKKDSK